MLALSIENLYKKYANGYVALKNINLKVEQGCFFALLGPNGAGKSSLIKILAQLSRPSQGKIQVFGKDLQDKYTKLNIGVVPQEFNFNGFNTVKNNLLFHAGYFGVKEKEAWPRIEKLLKRTQLWNKQDARCMDLSGGMKRRFMIVRALIHSPNLLLLDEPTVGIDIALRNDTYDFLKELNAEGVSIILTTHYLEEVEKLCKELAVIDQGEIIVQAKIGEILAGLQQEKFILHLSQNNITDWAKLAGFACQILDRETIAVWCSKNKPIHELFDILQLQNTLVNRIWKDSSRLEEWFSHITNTK